MQSTLKLTKSYQDKIASWERAISKYPTKMRWTPEEDAFLIKYYHAKGSKAVAEVLGKSRKSVLARYQIVGVRNK